MTKTVKKARSKPNPPVISKSRGHIVEHVPEDKTKPDFIGRLKGVSRIVGDIESPAEEWECCREDDLERINQAAGRLNAEASDALDCQTVDCTAFPADAKKRGRGRPRHTS